MKRPRRERQGCQECGTFGCRVCFCPCHDSLLAIRDSRQTAAARDAPRKFAGRSPQATTGSDQRNDFDAGGIADPFAIRDKTAATTGCIIIGTRNGCGRTAGRGLIMSITIVQLGSPRRRDEGIRLGTVRRPPRGVRKDRYAKDDWYDVWLPSLAPSQPLLASVRSSSSGNWWKAFERRFRAEMSRPEASGLLDALAALSHSADFSVGCYCDDESRCHRSVLRQLLAERGAKLR